MIPSRRRRRAAGGLGAAVLLLVVVAVVLALAATVWVVAARSGGNGDERLGEGVNRAPEVCDLVGEISLPPSEWVNSSGALAIPRTQAGGVAVAFGMAAQINPEATTQASVAQVLSRRLDGAVIPLTTAERQALENLERTRAHC